MNRVIILTIFIVIALYSSYRGLSYYQGQLKHYSTIAAQLQKNIESLDKTPIQDGDLTKYDKEHGTTLSSYRYRGSNAEYNDASLDAGQNYAAMAEASHEPHCLKTNSCNQQELIEYTKYLEEDAKDKISLIADVIIPIFNGVMILLISGAIIFIVNEFYKRNKR